MLTDISHSTPVKTKSNNFFCNAQGSGKSDYIICNYNPLVWDEKMFIGKIFYTSGLGGIYPSGVKIGTLDKINEGDVNNIELEIRLIANVSKSPSAGNWLIICSINLNAGSKSLALDKR